MAKEKFRKNDLTLVAAQVKRTIIRQAKNGVYLDNKLSKINVFEKVATRLNVSLRTVQTPERLQYLNPWFSKILQEVEQINHSLSYSENESIDEFKNKKIGEILEELKREKQLRKACERKNKELLKQVDHLTKLLMNKYEKLDIDVF